MYTAAANSPPPSSATQSEGDDDQSPMRPHQHRSVPKKPPLPQNQTLNEDDAEEELASVTRLPAVTLQLWGSLLKPRGYEISEGELLRSPSKAHAAAQLVPQQPPTPAQDAEEGGSGSVIVQCRRANSFAPARPPVPPSSRPLPFKRARTVPGLGNPPDEGMPGSFIAPVPSAPLKKNGESSTASRSNIFAGLRILALGEAKSTSGRVEWGAMVWGRRRRG